MKRIWRKVLISALAVAVVVASYFAQFYWFPDGWPIGGAAVARNVNISPVSQVIISEVMSSNKTAHPGAGGLYADWVEIYNSGSSPADITGWTLTDNANSAISFTFPEHIMQPGEFVLVYLTDVLVNEPGLPYQAPFKISSRGDQLMLYDDSGSIMEAITIPALSSDTSYARIGSTGEFIVTKLYTPGLINTNDSYRSRSNQEQLSDMPLRITEIMPSNGSARADENGIYSDWVEIRNDSSSPVSLLGCGLSDDIYDRFKWSFPDITLGAGESIVIYCSGVSGERSAGFRLSSQGEQVVLTDSEGAIIDMVEFGYSQTNQSWVRQSDGSLAARSW
ncbi:MAG: lamin tail domain-containing protein [Clostridia bacterium]|nr:lamin tail domain-containing protein [Clostridia bacterium]